MGLFGDVSILGLVVMAVTAALSFGLGRWWSRGWRAQRRAREEAAARAGESRQARRARERERRKR